MAGLENIKRTIESERALLRGLQERPESPTLKQQCQLALNKVDDCEQMAGF
jgi:hypothetical protein